METTVYSKAMKGEPASSMILESTPELELAI